MKRLLLMGLVAALLFSSLVSCSKIGSNATAPAELFNKKFEEYGIGIDSASSSLYWSPKGNFIVFEGTRVKSENDVRYAIIIADLVGNKITVVKEGRLQGTPAWSPDERTLVISSDGLYICSLETMSVKKISNRGYMPQISGDNKKIAYVNDGIWIFDIERISSVQLTNGKYDTFPLWFSDNRRLFYFRDTGKELGDGAGNEQVMSIIDISDPKSFKDVYSTKKEKFTSAKWLVNDELLDICAGWDDMFHSYILDLRQESLVDVGEIYYSEQRNTILLCQREGKVLKAKDSLVEVFDFSMKKIAHCFINSDSEYPQADENSGFSFLPGNRIIYLHANSQENRGAIMVSYLDGSQKQVRVTGYGNYSVPYVSLDSKKIAYIENGQKLWVINVSELNEIEFNTVESRNRGLNELLMVFPDTVGTCWTYYGLAEYGHKMRLDGISKRSNGSVEYYVSGYVNDPSGGKAKGDFSINMKYVFSNKAVRETVIKGDKLPHKIKDFDILRYPLKKGNSWTQTVKIDGKTTRLKAKITEDRIEEETNLRVLTVEYIGSVEGVPGGMYREVRTFKERMGLQSFESQFGKNIQFNYILNSVKQQ